MQIVFSFMSSDYFVTLDPCDRSYRGCQRRLLSICASDTRSHRGDFRCQGCHLQSLKILLFFYKTIVFTVEFSGFAATMVLISVTMVMISAQLAAAALAFLDVELARLSTFIKIFI